MAACYDNKLQDPCLQCKAPTKLLGIASPRHRTLPPAFIYTRSVQLVLLVLLPITGDLQTQQGHHVRQLSFSPCMVRVS